MMQGVGCEFHKSSVSRDGIISCENEDVSEMHGPLEPDWARRIALLIINMIKVRCTW